MTKAVEKVESMVPVTKEIVAAINRIDAGVKQMRSSGLSERALIILISQACGESKTTIENVLQGMSDMKRQYLK